MSCAWGFHCEQCDEKTETIFNHGDDILLELMQNIEIIKKIRASKNLTIGWNQESEHFDDFVAFIEKHKDHWLLLINEYGEAGWFDNVPN